MKLFRSNANCENPTLCYRIFEVDSSYLDTIRKDAGWYKSVAHITDIYKGFRRRRRMERLADVPLVGERQILADGSSIYNASFDPKHRLFFPAQGRDQALDTLVATMASLENYHAITDRQMAHFVHSKVYQPLLEKMNQYHIDFEAYPRKPLQLTNSTASFQ